MLDVFITVDVELWCDGWVNIDQKFPAAFQKYIFGDTRQGRFGLPYQLEVLNSHGLAGVFFVEPLFSARFGLEPLQEIVGLILDAKQEVQLHLHTEWVDEAREPLVLECTQKRQHLRFFNADEQSKLIGTGMAMLKASGASELSAFRAGSFAFNQDTLPACVQNGIRVDSSYNASMFGMDSGVLPGETVVEPTEINGIFEYPMTVFNDGTGLLRHAQLTACSWRELEYLLWQAVEKNRGAFILLSHGFELMDLKTSRPDRVVIQRFHKLCEFLDNHRDVFNVRGFNNLPGKNVTIQPSPLTSPLWLTGGRIIEQLYRRLLK